ncbi:pseudaminic acid cytidylyltransferase [Cylindrospermopsis raciborskii]|uniref:pseudaminic acid cytidylyltransferase n=1 Tax=Cylindrospermopsis raciborskii TaxID=77022 RepID=UPI0022C6ECED|nr:pseudaminic acid cytidylyltransferase [Cylindrospermopsis raciborskii]MCZ2207794.1 pseudaminic acid cytidylyltransferase [Cylindrospermopsis raciborskii PAMP2011]
MNIAIIPARGGSKRIPRKNIKAFCGKPMIAYAIEAAQESGLFEHILVSTDDGEIDEISRKWDAEVPFKRPAELADDHTPTVPVIAHAIRECEGLGWQIGRVCCIYPCVPFIQVADVRSALNLLESCDAKYSFPVTQFPAAIQRALKQDQDGKLSPIYPECELIRSQDIEPAYHDAGQFYWASKKAWLTVNSIYSNAIGLTIPQWRVVDIDNLDDWHRAEILHKILNNEALIK